MKWLADPKYIGYRWLELSVKPTYKKVSLLMILVVGKWLCHIFFGSSLYWQATRSVTQMVGDITDCRNCQQRFLIVFPAKFSATYSPFPVLIVLWFVFGKNKHYRWPDHQKLGKLPTNLWSLAIAVLLSLSLRYHIPLSPPFDTLSHYRVAAPMWLHRKPPPHYRSIVWLTPYFRFIVVAPSVLFLDPSPTQLLISILV